MYIIRVLLAETRAKLETSTGVIRHENRVDEQ